MTLTRLWMTFILFACPFVAWGAINPQVAINPLYDTRPELSNTAGAPLDDSWERLSDGDGIVVHKRKLPGSKFVEFRGTGTIDAPVSKILNVLLDTPRKLEWVDRAVEARDIRTLSPVERVEYNRTSAPWPVKDRDFLFQAKAFPNLRDKTVLITLKSIEDEAVPVDPCCVRGELARSSYFLKAIKGGTATELTVQIHADPRGAVPSWIVNMIQKSWPRKTMQALREQVAKPDVAENALFKSLLENTSGG